MSSEVWQGADEPWDPLADLAAAEAAVKSAGYRPSGYGVVIGRLDALRRDLIDSLHGEVLDRLAAEQQLAHVLDRERAYEAGAAIVQDGLRDRLRETEQAYAALEKAYASSQTALMAAHDTITGMVPADQSRGDDHGESSEA